MPSNGIPYKLVGPTGVEAVFNEPENANFVGYLNAETGITGLLDTPEIREGYFDKPEAHGGVQTNSWFSHRIGTIQGFVIPDPNMTVYNKREQAIKAASRGMAGAEPSYLYWTPEGSVERLMRVYRQGKVTFTGRRPKTFLIPLSSPDPYVYSAALHEQFLESGAATGDSGFPSPIGTYEPATSGYVLSTSYKEVGRTGIYNAGDSPAWPEFALKGPFSNPIFANYTTGRKFYLTCSLGEHEYLYINSQNRTVLQEVRNSSEEKLAVYNRYGYYGENFTKNEWWSLAPETVNEVFVLPAPYAGVASVAVRWRDAWE